MCTKTLALRPELIQVVESLVMLNAREGEEDQNSIGVYYVGKTHPYRIRMAKDEFYKLMDAAEREDD